jgi:hypothetical protein
MAGDRLHKDPQAHPGKIVLDPFQAEYADALKKSQEIAAHQKRVRAAMDALDPKKKLSSSEHEKAKVIAVQESKTAINLADANQTTANRVLGDFNKTQEPLRQALAKELGLNPASVSQVDTDRMLRSRTLSPEKREKIVRLATLQDELHNIKQLKETPAVTRTLAAYLNASGAVEAAPSASPEEKLRVSQRNAQEALTLLHDVPRFDTYKELVGTPLFATVTGKVNQKYAGYQQELALQTYGAFAGGDDILKGQGSQNDPVKKAKAEAQYEAAYSYASKLDLTYVAAHQVELVPNGKQKDGLTIQDVYDLAVSRKSQVLLNHGKYEEALPLMVKLQADVPNLKKDAGFQGMLNQAYFGSTNDDLVKHQQAFRDIYFRKEDHKLSEDEAKKKYGAALFELNGAADAYGKRSEQMTKGLQSLQEEKRKLDLELKNVDSRNLDQAEKKLETDRLTKEMIAVRTEINRLNRGIELNKISVADVAYYQGTCRFAMGDLEEANERFSYAKDHDSQYAVNTDAKLDDYIHATNWWSRHNWLKQGLLMVAAVTAGIVVGALLSETGPGGAIAGYATAEGIIGAGTAETTLAVGINSTMWGSAAGSLTYAGGTAAFGDPVTASTFVRGAGLGGGGAAFNVVRMAFAPAVLAGTVPRVVAGMTAGGTYGLTSGVPGFIADKMDGVSTKAAWQNFGTNFAFSTVLGGFTPLRSFQTISAGEVALNNVWRTKVIPNLAGASPILIQPSVESTLIQYPLSAIEDGLHKPVVPKKDPSQVKHDFSKDQDTIKEIDEKDDLTVEKPKHQKH